MGPDILEQSQPGLLSVAACLFSLHTYNLKDSILLHLTGQGGEGGDGTEAQNSAGLVQGPTGKR